MTVRKSGGLSIVSTPIGNLQDITLRALETLKSVDLIACEDTRHTGKLLKHYGIKQTLRSLHDHNERQQLPGLIRFLQENKSVALVSDGGTPLINDPGWRLVHAAISEKIPVTWVPGPAALIGGLVLSGLPTDRFVFEGFLPPKSAARRKRLASLKTEQRTIVCYESPYRVLALLKDIHAELGDVAVACARELTKLFEEVQRGRVSEVIAQIERKPPKGEYAVVIKMTSDPN